MDLINRWPLAIATANLLGLRPRGNNPERRPERKTKDRLADNILETLISVH